MTTQNQKNVIDLEILQREYTNLLSSYNSAVTEYSNYIEQILQTGQQQKLVSIRGYAYNGTGNATTKPNNASNVQQCEAACAKLGNCSGATFISQKCYLKKGDSGLVTSSASSYAIVPKGKQLLLNMDNLNQQLLSVNKKILDKINVDQPLYDRSVSANNIMNQELVANYDNLLAERSKIEEMLNEYNTLTREDDKTQIKTTKNYYTYILLVILVLIIIFMIYKLFSPTSSPQIQYGGGDLGISAYFFVGLLVIGIIILNSYLRK